MSALLPQLPADLRGVLARFGFERIGAFPVAPLRRPGWVRYCTHNAPRSERWAVRTAEADFALLPVGRHWTTRRVYSYGWGWHDRGSADVLLAQGPWSVEDDWVADLSRLLPDTSVHYRTQAGIVVATVAAAVEEGRHS